MPGTLTRRLFAGLLAGAATASANVSGFVQHKLLRRPYAVSYDSPAVDCRLYDCILLRGEFGSPLRVKAEQQGNPEPVLEMTITPRSGEFVKLLSIHRLRATAPVKITLSAAKPFKLHALDIKLMHPPFRRVDGMVYYHDPAFSPHPDYIGFGVVSPIHRVLGPPAVDVSYGGGHTVRFNNGIVESVE